MAVKYILKLYVTGATPRSQAALNNLKKIMDVDFKGVYSLKVIDVVKQPKLAEDDKILATPTLIRMLPPPIARIIGDLSDREKVLLGLDLVSVK
jgi:circadian clock protein KaiB